MTGRSIRAALAADPTLGAGNVVATLVARGMDPDEPTLTFDTDVDGTPAGQPLTLGRLDRAVAARAGWLYARGIRRADPVVVYASSAADHHLSFLALTRLGAIPALINGNLDAELAAAYIDRLGAAGVLTDAAHRTVVDHGPGLRMLGDVAETGGGDPGDAPPPYRHYPDDPIVITHSSGTTAVPKAVVSSHGSLFAAIRHRLSVPRPQGADRMLCALPAAHNATLTALNLSLCNRGQALMLSNQRGETVLDAIERWRPGMVLGFAVTWSELARLDLSTRDLDSVCVWWNTGDCVHEAHIRRLVSVGSHALAGRRGVERRPGSILVDGLGSSEMGHSQFHVTHRQDATRSDRCIGRPHAFTEVAVLGPDGERLPAGEVGQLGVRSPTVTPGYWNDSGATYRSRHGGWFLPGEYVRRDEDDYFYHLDRVVDAVDLGEGHRVYTALSEERVLAACPDVIDCTVVAMADGGRVITDVLLCLARGADPDLDRTAQVRVALRDERVAATVRRVVVVPEEEIPLGATGKVRKVVLRERHAQGRVHAVAGTP